MEITNERRREVAKALRNEASFMETLRDWYNDSNVDIELKGNRTYRNIAGSVEKWSNFGDHYEETVLKLADLIDRPTCHDAEDERSKAFTCSACGFSDSKLIFNPFGIDLIELKPDFHYCPNCGAEVVE